MEVAFIRGIRSKGWSVEFLIHASYTKMDPVFVISEFYPAVGAQVVFNPRSDTVLDKMTLVWLFHVLSRM